jgi:hypothetical protein
MGAVRGVICVVGVVGGGTSGGRWKSNGPITYSNIGNYWRVEKNHIQRTLTIEERSS